MLLRQDKCDRGLHIQSFFQQSEVFFKFSLYSVLWQKLTLYKNVKNK